MVKGRKPIPTSLKVLRGNPGHQKLRTDQPKPVLGIPGCPPQLGPIAHQEWERISGALHKLGLLTLVDQAALAGYCACYARWLQAEEDISKNGTTIVNPRGAVQRNPAVKVAHDALALMLRYLAEFGLSPSSRERLHATPAADETQDDLFERFISGG